MLDAPFHLRLLASLLLIALIIALSVVPGSPKPGDSAFVWAVAATPPLLQKAMHVAIYGLLALLVAWTLMSVVSRWAALCISLLLCVLLGACLEWVQLSIPGRFGSLTDIGLNSTGAILGLIAAMILL